MTQPIGVWINLDPEPVPNDDPRVRNATLVADGAWINSPGPTTAIRIRDVVRAVLAHIDDLAKIEADREMDIHYDPNKSVDETIAEHVNKRYR